MTVQRFLKTAWGKLLSSASLITVISWGVAIAQTPTPLLKLSIGGHRIEVEVAETPEARDRGLMYRYSLPLSHGMLFIFPEAHAHCMWMKNTYIPLSVAFIDDKGKIVNIADMQPGSLSYYCATRPVHYALEMNEGWFSLNRISKGARINGIKNTPQGR